MPKVPNFSDDQERVTELDGKEYRLRPTLAFIRIVEQLNDAVEAEDFDKAEQLMPLTLKAGMSWNHTDEEITDLVQRMAFPHLMAFCAGATELQPAPLSPDAEDFLNQMMAERNGQPTGTESGQPLESISD